MSRSQIVAVVLVCAVLVGWAGVLVWPATDGAPFTVVAMAGVVAVMWWQAWQQRHNSEARDANIANAAIAAAIFLLMADDVQILAEVARDCTR